MEKRERPKRDGMKRPSYDDRPNVFEWEQDLSPIKSKLPVPAPAQSRTIKSVLPSSIKTAPSAPSTVSKPVKSILPSSLKVALSAPSTGSRTVKSMPPSAAKVDPSTCSTGPRTVQSALPSAIQLSPTNFIKSALSTSPGPNIAQRKSVAFLRGSGATSKVVFDGTDQDGDVEMRYGSGSDGEERFNWYYSDQIYSDNQSDIESDAELSYSDVDENSNLSELDSESEGHGSDSCCDSDSGPDHDHSDHGAWAMVTAEKYKRWGVNDKDWTKPTDLDQWLRTKDEHNGEGFLASLTAEIKAGRISMKQFEQDLAPEQITRFWWNLKPALERCRNQNVTAIVGHCPQYNSPIPSYPKAQLPEESSTLTDAIISAVANMITLPCIWWDLRPDCKKLKPAKGKTYAGCTSPSHVEFRQLIRLNDMLVQAAAYFYGIRIASTLSFSTAANKFVKTLQGPHVTLPKHIAKMRSDWSLAIVLCQGLAEKGLTNLTWMESYNMLASYLSRGPGEEAGRSRILLPALQESVASASEQVLTVDDVLAIEYAKDNEYQNRPKTKARGKAYRARPEVKIRMKEHRSTPGYKAKKRANRLKPANLIKDKERQKAYSSKPESKEKKRESRLKPENLAKEQERAQRPEIKARHKVYKQQEKYKEKEKERRNKPEAKARTKELRNSSEAKARRTAKRKAKNPPKRLTSSQRAEAIRMRCDNPNMSHAEVVAWIVDTYGITIKEHTVRNWHAPRNAHLDASEDEDEDEIEVESDNEDGDGMDYEPVDD